MAIWRKTEKESVMSWFEFVVKRSSHELINLMDLEETLAAIFDILG